MREALAAGLPHCTEKGGNRPASPASVFPNIAPSQIPTTVTEPRNNSNVLMANRSAQADELPEFETVDNIKYDDISNIVSNNLGEHAVGIAVPDCVIVQSKECEGGIPRFVLKVQTDLSCAAYHLGVQCNIVTLSRNRITTICKASILDEAVRFLRTREATAKHGILVDSLITMEIRAVGISHYSAETVVRALENFVTSRTLYSRLHCDYHLPSVRTLCRYVSHNEDEEDDEGDSYKIFEQHGDFLRAMNRGGLKIPRDTVCQWTMLCVAFFVSLESPACRTALVRYLSDIASFCNQVIPLQYCFTLANILLRCSSAFNTRYSAREPSQKLLKVE